MGGGGYGAPGPSSGPPPPSSATLTVATDARLGEHLIDGNGRSLYYFAKDVPAGGNQPAVSNCDDATCLPIWPVFGPDSVVVQGIAATDVGQITRSDGKKQTTYKGFPIYSYTGDAAAGDTKGEGFDGFWFVAHDPTYSIAQLSKPNQAATYLTDAGGRALYAFAPDAVGTSTTAPMSACTSAQCVATWPIFEVDQAVVPSDLSSSGFTVFTRGDGRRQSAYEGHPLYYYAGDAAPGETNGRGVPGWRTIDPHAP